MAWEVGKSGRRYFYLSVRDGARVVKKYLGCGFLAWATYFRLEERKRVLTAIKGERERDSGIDYLVKLLDQRTQSLVCGLMVTAGFSNVKSRGFRVMNADTNGSVALLESSGDDTRVSGDDRAEVAPKKRPSRVGASRKKKRAAACAYRPVTSKPGKRNGPPEDPAGEELVVEPAVDGGDSGMAAVRDAGSEKASGADSYEDPTTDVTFVAGEEVTEAAVIEPDDWQEYSELSRQCESPVDPVYERLDQLVRRIRQGDRTVASEIELLLEENPGLVERNSQLAWTTQEKLVQRLAGDNAAIYASLMKRVADLKEQFFNETSQSVAEEMLVDLIVATYLQTWLHELTEATDPAQSPALGEYRIKKIESAHTRLLKAMKTLHQIQGVGLLERAGRRRAVA